MNEHTGPYVDSKSRHWKRQNRKNPERKEIKEQKQRKKRKKIFWK